MSHALNLWSGRSAGNNIDVESDLQAIHCARQLGLLPVPGNISELSYQLIT
jgi:hypothetical protein